MCKILMCKILYNDKRGDIESDITCSEMSYYILNFSYVQ